MKSTNYMQNELRETFFSMAASIAEANKKLTDLREKAEFNCYTDAEFLLKLEDTIELTNEFLSKTDKICISVLEELTK